MVYELKSLIAILSIAVAIFALAKPVCAAFMLEEDFARRRNVWLTLTACAFLSPSFWIYAFFAVIAVVWSARRDSNPAALYLMFYAVIPPVVVDLPAIGFNHFFTLSEARLLALVLLLPLAARAFSINEDGRARRWTSVDLLLVSYLLLQVVLTMPYESITNTMRRGFLFGLDILLPYYVFSRVITKRQALTDAMAVLTLVGAIFAAIGVFEWLKGWLLYEYVGSSWGSPNIGAYMMRADSLRAQASAGHSLTYGYILTVAFAFWLHLRTYVASQWARWATTGLLCIGIYVSHSRGPWLTAVIVYFTYLMLAGGASGAAKGVFSGLVLMVLLSLTPVGGRIIELIPFIGSAEQGTVLYRQQLAEESWRLVLQNPVFGDPFVLVHMDDLRSTDGLVDLMNAYATVALFCGLVGLSLFALFLLLSTAKAFMAVRGVRAFDPDLASVGAALVAAMVGSLFFMAAASIDWVEYVLAGLLCAYAALASSPAEVTTAAPSRYRSPSPASLRES
jgi:hypothetical protein